MKRKIIILLGLLLSSAAFSNEKYSIKIKIDGTSDSLCILAVYYGDKQYIKDTGWVDKKGYYVFEGDEKLDGGMYIIAGQKKNTYFEFLVADDQEFTLKTDTSNLKGNLIVKGSEENQLFFDYLKYLDQKQKEAKPIVEELKSAENEAEKKKIQEKLSKINEEVKNYQLKLIENNIGTFTANFVKATLSIDVPEPPKETDEKEARRIKYNYYRDHYWDNFELNDERLLRTPFFHNKLSEYFEKVLLQDPDTIIYYSDSLINKVQNNKEMFKYLVWYTTRMAETSKIMGMDKAFVHLAQKYYLSNLAYWASPETLKSIEDRANTLKKLLVGVKAPDLIMVDTSYRRVSVYNTKAEYLLVFFYDPDCGHCKKEIAKLKPFYEEYKQKGIEVFAIYSEADVEHWKKFVKEQNFEWINSINGYNIDYHKLYDIISTPTIYLLDKEKKVIAKRLSADQVISIVKRELGEKVEQNNDETK